MKKFVCIATIAVILSAILSATAFAATANVTTIYYGKSVKDQTLTMYKITPSGTTNGKTVFLNFTLHGWEDAWERDGFALQSIATAIRDYYKANDGLLKGWTVYIVPCANPDGLNYGINNSRASASNDGTGSAYGRCTSEHYDMNRTFSTISASISKCDEAYYLKTQIESIKPTVLIDFHGWFSGFYGNSAIGKCFLDAFKSGPPTGGYYGISSTGSFFQNSDKSFDNLGATGSSYLTGWAISKGIASTLVEFPAPAFKGTPSLQIHKTSDIDAYTGNYRKYIDDSALTFLVNRTETALNSLFLGYK